jgi:tRNA-dependent cyclodipeptide synthase
MWCTPVRTLRPLLVGTGTREVKARRRARSQAARNVRDIESALAVTGAELRAGRVLMFDDLRRTEAYWSLYNATRSEFETNDSFRAACVAMTHKAIESRRDGIATTEGIADHDADNSLDVKAASQYVLAEMPLFLDPASMTGTGSAMLCYHSPWPIAAQIFGGHTRMRVAQRCGYLVVTELTNDQRDAL